MRWLLLFGLVGCSAELTPRAAATAAACEVEPGPWTGDAFGDRDLSEPCLEALAADFSVDLPLDDAEASALTGAHALLAFDWGSLGDAPLDDALDEVAATTGDDAVGWLAYEYAAHRIHGLEAGSAGEGSAATYRHLTHTVVWEDPLPAPVAAGVLVHEARHGDGERHVPCADGSIACDEDRHGAYGFEATLLARAAERAEGVLAITLHDLADEARAHIR
jgi:hypothetical protein